MRKEELRTYIENHESEMIEDLKSLIRIPSEKQAANHSAHRRRKHWHRELGFWKNTVLL